VEQSAGVCLSPDGSTRRAGSSRRTGIGPAGSSRRRG